MSFYDTFGKKKRKNQISVNLYNHQLETINMLVEKEIYHSRSECIRIALELWLSSEYVKALNHKREKIISKIKKHNGNNNNGKEKYKREYIKSIE